MSAVAYKVILFDLGGVLIENAGRDGLHALLPYKLDRRQVLELWLASPAVKRFERGLIRTQHHVACLSNTNSVHWARFPDLPGLFDSVFASHLT